MPAAYLALEDVNNKQDLLPDFQLTLHSNDSEVGWEKSINFIHLKLFQAEGESC